MIKNLRKVLKMAKKMSLPVAKAGGPASIAAAIDGPDRISVSEQKERRRYIAEDALRDIERAEKHKRDASLMKDVKAMAKEKMASLKKIC